MKKYFILLASLLVCIILLASCVVKPPEGDNASHSDTPKTSNYSDEVTNTHTNTHTKQDTSTKADTDTEIIETKPTETEDAENTVDTDAPSTVDYQNLPKYVPGSIILEDRKTDDYSFERKYRQAFYTIQGVYFETLLNDEQYKDFFIWSDKLSKETNGGEYRDEMVLVQFIKRYNITREQFDLATQKYIKQCAELGTDTRYEEREVPNGDIIFTFDNKIINYYYRYE